MFPGYDQIRLLPLAQQLPLLWTHGTFLAWRWDRGTLVHLLHLPGGFFCEIYYHLTTKAILRTRYFTASADLDVYARFIDLGNLDQPEQ